MPLHISQHIFGAWSDLVQQLLPELHLLHSEHTTASVDGWIRGDPIAGSETKLVSAADQHPELKLARTILPVTLPMHTGFYDGEDVYYVITDSSTQKYADEISQWQNYNVTAAPLLEETPETALGKVYLFKNGKSGEGLYGYQQEIFSGTPEQQMYGSLRLAVVAEWNQGHKKSVIESEKDLLEQVKNGRIVLDESETILNIPQIKWPGGQMPQIENLTMADYEESPYGTGSQILSFDEENMSVTLVSHREWAEDGRTLYCVPFDSTPEKPATLMGLVNAPASSILANSDAAADYYEFKNGISGSGLLGFQPSLRYGIPGSENYSPIQKINIVEWINPGEAQILATENDLNDAYANESITITQARPLNSDHTNKLPSSISCFWSFLQKTKRQQLLHCNFATAISHQHIFADTNFVCTTTSIGSPRIHPSTLAVAVNEFCSECSASAAPAKVAVPDAPSSKNVTAYFVSSFMVHTGWFPSSPSSSCGSSI